MVNGSTVASNNYTTTLTAGSGNDNYTTYLGTGNGWPTTASSTATWAK